MRRTLATAGRTVAVQLADGRRRDRLAGRLPAALPVLDGHRRLLRRADRRRDRADRAARRADAARRARELAHARVPGPARRARRAAGARGLLVPPLAARDALPGPDRRHHGDAADRARPPVPRHRVHVGRRPGAARVRERPPGRRRRCARTSRPTATRRSRWPSRAAPDAARARRAPAAATCPAPPRCSPPRRLRRRHLRDRRGLRAAPPLDQRSQDLVRDLRALDQATRS